MRTSHFRRTRLRAAPIVFAVVVAALVVGTTSHVATQTTGTGWKVVAWNNLGMHCMDADFSVFSILPPYNTIQAQVVDSTGRLVTTGISVTYEGVADAAGSVNRTSIGKTNFWSYVTQMFGVALADDEGLLHHNMPGSKNVPQPMVFDSTYRWFIAEGIPITPYDDAGAKNYYPMMKVTAKDSSGTTLASTNIVLPVSDEMNCTACHSSSSGPAARPKDGWVNDPSSERDYRLNILRLHDDRQLGTSLYANALSTRGYDTAGLYTTAMGGKAILCANCHKSEALAGSGFTGVLPLTSAIHSRHASVVDPTNGQTLDSSANRSACYRCHPGSETRCLRGTMGSAVAADGTMAIQCQNCHGSMSAVGDSNRTGWLNEPTCQSCHTGTASQNSGAIRFTSVFDSTGKPRVAANATFATSSNTPATGSSLYRFSAGHGGMQCSACHGSTHAEYSSSHRNDNAQSIALQGHVGTIAECTTCHTTVPSTYNGGPHGMHPVGQTWISSHDNAAQANLAGCQACHGPDYRGTVLSRAFGARTLSTGFGTKQLFRGAQVGCYMCHNGPGSDGANSNHPPVASDLSASTSGTPVGIKLAATDADSNALTLRIVSQPANGTVGLSGTTATYYPYAGFSGSDTFTYAAWDGSIDSNLATVTVAVTAPAPAPCTLTSSASAPTTATVGADVAFKASATPANCSGSVAYSWTFGDNSASSVQNPTHAYSSAGTFVWKMTASISGVTSIQSGSIAVSSAPAPASAPVISRVSALVNPSFRIRIDGANFQAGVKVYIGNDTTGWANTELVSSQRLILSGSGLLERFPSGVPVEIRVVNPDNQSASATFTRGKR